MILQVGRWVLDEACRQAGEWQRQGKNLSISINVSTRQLETDSFLEHVGQALEASRLDPKTLVLEITESTLMRDAERTARRLQGLKSLGVLIAIDDFGTGYSSLSYLRQFPVDALKIDRSFIAGMAESAGSAALIHTLVELGHSLGLDTVAEGIEDLDQLETLRAERCRRGQGFLFSRPIEASAIEAILQDTPMGAESNTGGGSPG